MNKSVYSLVLMDDVIKAVDKEAYRQGTSRSNLINQILAEHLACETPEMRMRSIFDYLSELAGSSFRIQEQRSASLMTMQTALDYRYRPTISYKIELSRSPGDYIGRLRVQMRTKNELLLGRFRDFFVYRTAFEASLLPPSVREMYDFVLTGECFSRSLFNSFQSHEKTGELISRYIKNLDSSFQAYLMDYPESAIALSRCENDYKQLITEALI